MMPQPSWPPPCQNRSCSSPLPGPPPRPRVHALERTQQAIMGQGPRAKDRRVCLIDSLGRYRVAQASPFVPS
jgi:hypothetical protein